MKAPFKVPDELFRRYVNPAGPPPEAQPKSQAGGGALLDGAPLPAWFGALRKYACRVEEHDMDALRASIAEGLARERGL